MTWRRRRWSSATTACLIAFFFVALPTARADRFRDAMDSAVQAYAAKAHERTVTSAEVAVSARPESVEARAHLVKALCELKRCDVVLEHTPLLDGAEGEAAVAVCLRNCPPHLPAMVDIQAAYEARAYTWARAALESYLGFIPDDIDAVKLAGMVACQLRRPLDARRYIRRLRGADHAEARKICVANGISVPPPASRKRGLRRP